MAPPFHSNVTVTGVWSRQGRNERPRKALSKIVVPLVHMAIATAANTVNPNMYPWCHVLRFSLLKGVFHIRKEVLILIK